LRSDAAPSQSRGTFARMSRRVLRTSAAALFAAAAFIPGCAALSELTGIGAAPPPTPRRASAAAATTAAAAPSSEPEPPDVSAAESAEAASSPPARRRTPEEIRHDLRDVEEDAKAGRIGVREAKNRVKKLARELEDVLGGDGGSESTSEALRSVTSRLDDLDAALDRILLRLESIEKRLDALERP